MAEASIYERVRADERPLYFAHVPKTAGTSFYAVLDRYFPVARVCPWNTPDHLDAQPRERWQGYQLYRGHFGWRLHERLDRDPWMITMMRDPLQREISAIHHGMRDVQMRAHLPNTLCEFVRLPDARERMAKAYRDYLVRHHDGMSVEQWVEGAKQALDQCLFVGLAERFDDAIALLAYKMGWWPSEHVAPHNVKPDHQRVEIPADTLEILRDVVAPTNAIYEHAVQRFDRDLRDMHRDLLDQRYRDHGSDEPAVDHLLLRFDQPFRGGGWLSADQAASQHGMPMLWSGPGTESWLRLRLRTDRDLSLQVHIGNAVSQQVVESLALTVNGAPVPMTLRSISGRQVLGTANLPVDVLRRGDADTLLTFRVDQTRSWHQLDASCPDTLQRGVAFCQLKVEPSATTAAAPPAGISCRPEPRARC